MRSLALQIADYGYVLQTGRIVLSGPARELLHDPRIRDAYLGRASQERAMPTPSHPRTAWRRPRSLAELEARLPATWSCCWSRPPSNGSSPGCIRNGARCSMSPSSAPAWVDWRQRLS